MDWLMIAPIVGLTSITLAFLSLSLREQCVGSLGGYCVCFSANPSCLTKQAS